MVDEIKTHTSIEDLFAREFPGVKLIRRGHRIWACCPFHQDSDPSFNIDIKRQRFKCFGCGAGGSVIDFYAKARNIEEDKEAIRQLAAELGLGRNLSPKERKAAIQARREREQAKELDERLAKVIKDVRLRCFDAERRVHQILESITHEEDLDKPEVIWALANKARIEHLANLFTSGTPAEQLEAALAVRGWNNLD